MGSYNFSARAAFNSEDMNVITSTEVADTYAEHWEAQHVGAVRFADAALRKRGNAVPRTAYASLNSLVAVRLRRPRRTAWHQKRSAPRSKLSKWPQPLAMPCKSPLGPLGFIVGKCAPTGNASVNHWLAPCPMCHARPSLGRACEKRCPAAKDGRVQAAQSAKPDRAATAQHPPCSVTIQSERKEPITAGFSRQASTRQQPILRSIVHS